jgi:hypothetical protein
MLHCSSHIWSSADMCWSNSGKISYVRPDVDDNSLRRVRCSADSCRAGRAECVTVPQSPTLAPPVRCRVPSLLGFKHVGAEVRLVADGKIAVKRGTFGAPQPACKPGNA